MSLQGLSPGSRNCKLYGGGESLSNSHLFLFRPPPPTAPQSPPPKPFPLPRPSLGRSQTPQECSPVTCAAAAVDVPLPPRPKETQRHLALTQLQKSREEFGLLVRASAPSFAEAEPGPSPRAGTGENTQGRALRFSSPLLGFHISRGSNDHHRHFSLSAFATASPDGAGPTRCCSMRSSLANHDAPDRTHQALIGCTDRLCLSPLRLPSAPGLWSEKTETAISGERPRKQEQESPCYFNGETLVLFFGFPLISSR